MKNIGGSRDGVFSSLWEGAGLRASGLTGFTVFLIQR